MICNFGSKGLRAQRRSRNQDGLALGGGGGGAIASQMISHCNRLIILLHEAYTQKNFA